MYLYCTCRYPIYLVAWDLATTHNWASNNTYSWGNLYKVT